jgi:hypothetical protein
LGFLFGGKMLAQACFNNPSDDNDLVAICEYCGLIAYDTYLGPDFNHNKKRQKNIEPCRFNPNVPNFRKNETRSWGV